MTSETSSEGKTTRGEPVWRDSATGDVVPYGPIEAAVKEACASTTREEGVARGMEILARELDNTRTRGFIEIANGIYVAAEVITTVRTQPGEVALGTSNGAWYRVDQDFCVSAAEKLGLDYTPPPRR